MSAYREAVDQPDERIREPVRPTRWTMRFDTAEPLEAWRELRLSAKAAHVALFVVSACIVLATVVLAGCVAFEAIVMIWPILLAVALTIAMVFVLYAAAYGLWMASMLLLAWRSRRLTERGLL